MFKNIASRPTHSYGVQNTKSNRVKAPVPVRIPQEVTEGIAMLRSIRMMQESAAQNSNYSFVHQLEESKSPEANISISNVS